MEWNLGWNKIQLLKTWVLYSCMSILKNIQDETPTSASFMRTRFFNYVSSTVKKVLYFKLCPYQQEYFWERNTLKAKKEIFMNKLDNKIFQMSLRPIFIKAHSNNCNCRCLCEEMTWERRYVKSIYYINNFLSREMSFFTNKLKETI